MICQNFFSERQIKCDSGVKLFYLFEIYLLSSFSVTCISFSCKSIKETMAESSRLHYKLTYFDARGVAEATRFIFAYASIPFEDIRIPREDWPSLKADTPFGQLPFLEVNGKQIGQSAAFTRLLAKRFGLAGKEDLEQAEVDAIVDYQKDIQAAMAYWWREEDKEKQTRLRDKFFKDDLGQYLATLERHLKSNPSGEYFTISGPTFADFSIASFFFTILKFYPSILDNFEALKKHVDRVHNLPGIKEWVAKRPQTEM